MASIIIVKFPYQWNRYKTKLHGKFLSVFYILKHFTVILILISKRFQFCLEESCSKIVINIQQLS